MDTTALIPAVLRHTADTIETTHYERVYSAGSAVYTGVHHATSVLITRPALEALRVSAGVDQIQFWRATKPETVDAIRAVADTFEDSLEDLQSAAAVHEMETHRRALLDALDANPGSPKDLSQVVAEVASRLTRLQGQVEDLEAEVARLRKELRTPKEDVTATT